MLYGQKCRISGQYFRFGILQIRKYITKNHNYYLDYMEELDRVRLNIYIQKTQNSELRAFIVTFRNYTTVFLLCTNE